MNELPSATFRSQYAKLTEPTVVTVHGHAIGTWTPIATPIEVVKLGQASPAQAEAIREDFAKLPGGGLAARQAQRDAVLRGINRSK